MKDLLISLTFNAILFTTIAFDPDGASYGAQLLGAGNFPAYLSVITDFIGNLLWVLGLLFLIGSIVVLFITFNDDLLKKEAEKVKAETPKKWAKWGKKQWYSSTLLGISIVGSVFALGSGFWFFGFTWLIMVLVTFAYSKEQVSVRKKLDAIELLETLEESK